MDCPGDLGGSARKRECQPSRREQLKEKIIEIWDGKKGRRVYRARQGLA
jgi:hypothetical protein